jgi:hypothetical protein
MAPGSMDSIPSYLRIAYVVIAFTQGWKDTGYKILVDRCTLGGQIQSLQGFIQAVEPPTERRFDDFSFKRHISHPRKFAQDLTMRFRDCKTRCPSILFCRLSVRRPCLSPGLRIAREIRPRLEQTQWILPW